MWRCVRYLILLISAVICKQRKLHENEVKQTFLEPEILWSLLGQFWEVLIKTKQLKILMPVSLTPKN